MWRNAVCGEFLIGTEIGKLIYYNTHRIYEGNSGLSDSSVSIPRLMVISVGFLKMVQVKCIFIKVVGVCTLIL